MMARYDIAIVGSGFAGSLLAMVARRAGRSVALIERGKHPRFAIGESSTPLANLLLEELADRYDLPRLKPLAKWGTWQQTYPQLACGLKRGFTFYHHNLGEAGPSSLQDRERQLLVAASPQNQIADTHWYRAEFDHFLAQEAQGAGVDYFDEVKLCGMSESDETVTVQGDRFGEPFAVQARFLVDATGARGFLHQALCIPEAFLPDFPQTQALFTHFSGVGAIGGDPGAPYSVDDSAVHHVFDGGWIWVLRFQNGITSAGVAATSTSADRLRFGEGAAAWARLLNLLPAVRGQFAGARVERPFVHVPRLPFLSTQITGRRWAMLPSAAAFVDPLLSTGFPLTLLGVVRLGEIFTEEWESPRFESRLQSYEVETREEALATARLVAALYATMHDFPLFRSITLIYFAAASFAEAARRLGRPELASSFLLWKDPVWGSAFTRLFAEARKARTAAASEDLQRAILRAIEPINIAGLGNPELRNWFPVHARDLFEGAGKLRATPAEIARLVERCGFSPTAASRQDPIVPPGQGCVP